METQDLTANKCRSCGFHSMDNFNICPKCGSKDWIKMDLSGNAEVYSFTIVHNGFGEMADYTPYILAMISLAEGYNITTILKNISIPEIKIGMKLKFSNFDPNFGFQFFHNKA